MKKHFYSHLATIDSVIIELGTLDIGYEERIHLTDLAQSTLHNAIINEILGELTSEQKRIFLEHVSNGENDKIWKLFDDRVERIEEKIRKISDEIKKAMLTDIDEVRKE